MINLNDLYDQGLFEKYLSQEEVGMVKRGETEDDVMRVTIALTNGEFLEGWQVVPFGKGLFHEMLDCPLLLQEPQNIIRSLRGKNWLQDGY